MSSVSNSLLSTVYYRGVSKGVILITPVGPFGLNNNNYESAVVAKHMEHTETHS